MPIHSTVYVWIYNILLYSLAYTSWAWAPYTEPIREQSRARVGGWLAERVHGSAGERRCMLKGLWARDAEKVDKRTDKEKQASADVDVSPVDTANPDAVGVVTSSVDVAVNQPVTMAVVKETTLSPLTWLPSLAYLTTFGFELAVDANLSNVL
ncbi:uncharacterized protein B0H18DRAFT_952970 [Fomitopsis serialis]|uniref:uncharacterized protein n=1 Tax=Fomitopsis serialis TaxID=139415 RepID=UPI0020089E9F|nr:uncharacterized protein B0H18DRAFT_952970 [Neoantrodia serialis]KAH9930973.1 hypothetical protein B0H18DRAFT_952970 [Neoantrodia serialis]